MMKETTMRREGSKRTRAKAAAAASCAALLALGAVMAALTATDTAVNRFELAEGLDVEVVEAAWDASPDADGDGVPDAAENLLPTQEVAKDPKVRNGTGTEAYVFCEVEVPIRHVATANADGTVNDAADVELFAYEVNDGWTLKDKVESEDGMSATYRYAWESTVAAGETGTVFDSVTYANVVDDGLSGADLLQELVVTGHGVQSLGFEDSDAAYEALFGPIAPAVTFTLTFDMGDTGIDQIDAIEIGEGKVAAAPEASAAEGYEVKWWKDAARTVEWDWAAPVAESATVYVTSTALPARIVFESNGGVAVASIEGVTGSDLGAGELPTTELSDSDTYVFDAWYTKNGAAAPATLDGTSEEDAWGHPVTSMAYFKYSMPAGTTTLYARYTDTTDTSKTPFAVFDKTDGSLTFYKRAASDVPSVGETYDGHTVSKVYLTGEAETATEITSSSISVWPWREGSTYKSVKSVEFVDTYSPHVCTYMFNQFSNLATIKGIENLDISKATSTQLMFNQCSSLKSLDLSSWNVSNVTSMERMFRSCSNLTSLDLSSFDTSNLTNLYQTFYDCGSLTTIKGIEDWNTSNITSLSYAFASCYDLTTLDLSRWDMSKVTQVNSMFSSCYALKSVNLSSLASSKMTRMYHLFYYCSSLTTITGIESWDTSNATDMKEMFYNCTALTELNLTSFNTAKVTDMTKMFYNCTSLASILIGAGWNVDSVTDDTDMFFKSTSLPGYKSTKVGKEKAVATTSGGYMTLCV